jgi:hypothetical protein
MLAEANTELEALFVKQDAEPASSLDPIRAMLNRRRYIANLVRDVEKELHVHLAN